MVRRGRFVLLILGLVIAGAAQAHIRSESFSRWEYDGHKLDMRYTINAREATRLSRWSNAPNPGQQLSRYLEQQLVVHSSDGLCRPARKFIPLAAQPGFLQVEASWQCSAPVVALEINAFFELAAEHAHYVSLVTPGQVSQRLLNRDDRQLKFDTGTPDNTEKAQNGKTFSAFLSLGFRHISSGLDHVVFLLALLLVCGRARDLVWAVTGFTFGHSLSLMIAALGMAQPNVPGIEATVGLTIALVAVERSADGFKNAWPLAAVCAALPLLMIPLGQGRLGVLGAGTLTGLALFVFCYLQLAQKLGSKCIFRVLITALFGLVHGFGFAGAFLAASLDEDSILLPLAGFNFGVELGQLVIVALMLMVFWVLKQFKSSLVLVTDVTAALVCGMGVFWFVQRSFF